VSNEGECQTRVLNRIIQLPCAFWRPVTNNALSVCVYGLV
jgi:hypothetical protein